MGMFTAAGGNCGKPRDEDEFPPPLPKAAPPTDAASETAETAEMTTAEFTAAKKRVEETAPVRERWREPSRMEMMRASLRERHSTPLHSIHVQR